MLKLGEYQDPADRLALTIANTFKEEYQCMLKNLHEVIAAQS